jgi:hypothetical protein
MPTDEVQREVRAFGKPSCCWPSLRASCPPGLGTLHFLTECSRTKRRRTKKSETPIAIISSATPLLNFIYKEECVCPIYPRPPRICYRSVTKTVRRLGSVSAGAAQVPAGSTMGFIIEQTVLRVGRIPIQLCVYTKQEGAPEQSN